MKLAMYKGEGQTFDKIIRWRTDSIYSHCELVANEVAFSSSMRDGGVRSKFIDFAPANWDFFEVVDLTAEARMLAQFERTKGQPYDWKGILIGQMFGTRAQSDGKAYCSEWVGEVFGRRQLSPEILLRELLQSGDVVLCNSQF